MSSRAAKGGGLLGINYGAREIAAQCLNIASVLRAADLAFKAAAIMLMSVDVDVEGQMVGFLANELASA